MSELTERELLARWRDAALDDNAYALGELVEATNKVLNRPARDRDAEVTEALRSVGIPLGAPLETLLRHHRNNAAAAAGGTALTAHVQAGGCVPRESSLAQAIDDAAGRSGLSEPSAAARTMAAGLISAMLARRTGAKQ